MKYWQHIPPTKSLLAVEATARHGSFSKAAAELNVTQSAVSHLVGQAERFLGTKLFQRQTRPVTLTEAGQTYVAALVVGFNVIQAEGKNLQKAKDVNVLTVSCNLAYANFWLLPRLKLFHQVHPNITVNMVTAYQGLPELSDEIDLAIRFGKGNWSNCESQLLISELIFPVASPAYLSRSEPISHPTDLLRHTLLHARADDKSWYDWYQWFDHHHIKCSTKLTGPHFDNHLVMMQAALAGEGIALGWIGTASDFVHRDHLIQLFSEKLNANGGVYLVTSKARKPSPAATLFAEWLSSTVS